MNSTITQNLSLFELHQSRRADLRIAVRFFNQRLKQLRRQSRRKQLQLLWLHIKSFLRP